LVNCKALFRKAFFKKSAQKDRCGNLVTAYFFPTPHQASLLCNGEKQSREIRYILSEELLTATIDTIVVRKTDGSVALRVY